TLWASALQTADHVKVRVNSVAAVGCVEDDCVYIESRRPNTPYFICSIQDFKL
ncbi:hypothetical protein U0070_016021, partial [Myodes glareolus]